MKSNMQRALLSFIPRLSRRGKDAIACFILVALVYVVCARLNFSEHFTAWALEYEFLDIDELPITLFATAGALAWYIRQRASELKEEIIRRIFAEQVATKNQRMFQQIFEEELCGNFIADTQGNIILCNQAFRNMANIHLGQESLINLFTTIGENWQDLYEDLLNKGKLDLPELKLKRNDGAPWVVISRLILVLNGQKREIHGYFADITELALAENDLIQLFNENRALSRHAMHAQEEERQHIAREIHDDLGQYLTAIRLDASVLENHSNNDVIASGQRITKYSEHIQVVIRRLLKNLRPTLLYEHGLVEAIHHMRSEWVDSNPNTNVQLSLGNICKNLPDAISIAIYRTVQEALTNISKHANAKHVKIKISASGEAHCQSCTLITSICDDGVGFNDPSSHSGFGLAGMRERAENLNGTLKLNDGNKSGTLITLRIPLPINMDREDMDLNHNSLLSEPVFADTLPGTADMNAFTANEDGDANRLKTLRALTSQDRTEDAYGL